MPVLPEKYNPFTKINILSKLKLGPKSSPAIVEKLHKKLSTKTTKKEEEKEALESIKNVLNQLKRDFSRVAINALVMDKVDAVAVKSYLSQLPTVKDEEIKLPPIDISQVYIDGQDVDISSRDFRHVDKDPQLELDWGGGGGGVKPAKIEKYHFFET